LSLNFDGAVGHVFLRQMCLLADDGEIGHRLDSRQRGFSMFVLLARESEDSHSVAFTVSSLRGRFTLHVMLNAYWEALDFELPFSPGQDVSRWCR
jgi:hypothetical protein